MTKTGRSALETLLMLRPKATVFIEYDLESMQFFVGYAEHGGPLTQFSASHRDLTEALDLAEAHAVEYIEELTG